MKLEDYLNEMNCTKADLGKRLGVSKALVGRWDEIPEKYQKILDEELPDDIHHRDWWVRGERLYWQVDSRGPIRDYGHGSEYDYDFSMAKIDFIRRLIKQLGSPQAVIEWVKPVEFPNEFILDVHKDCVCPNVVDMRKGEGRAVPTRVFPFGEREELENG